MKIQLTDVMFLWPRYGAQKETRRRPGNQNYSWLLLLMQEETQKLFYTYMTTFQGV